MKMGRFICAICGDEQHKLRGKNKRTFHSIPHVHGNMSERDIPVVIKRREAWLNILGDKARHNPDGELKVCAKHFRSGKT